MIRQQLAQEIVTLLANRRERLVLAESCTAGLIAASLGQIAGVSHHFCGSAVVYRPQTKMQWLGIDAEEVGRHSAESREVTQSLARNVLERTEEATISLAVTGHLGPDAPKERDGQIFLAVCVRQDATISSATTVMRRLSKVDRVERQEEAVCLALTTLKEQLLD